MKKHTLLIVTGTLVLLCFTLPLGAVDLKIDYLDGSLEYRKGNNAWQQLGIGDLIPNESSIRLSGNGFAELSAGARKITLTKDGVYSSTDLADDNTRAVNLRQLIGSKFSSLIHRADKSKNTAAAVRANRVNAGDFDDFITWEDDSTDYLQEGMALMSKGDFIGARELFIRGALWESGALQRECLFRQGEIEQILGNPRVARYTLTSVNPLETDPFLGEYSVVMATLYIESREYAKADSVLSLYLDSNPKDEAAQSAWYLSALSMDAQGNKSGSRSSLQKAVELGSDTEIGISAAQLLK